MNKEEQMICSHLLDLAEACDRRGYPMGSDFLTLNEQNLFLAFSKDKLPPVSMEMCGGYELADSCGRVTLEASATGTAVAGSEGV